MHVRLSIGIAINMKNLNSGMRLGFTFGLMLKTLRDLVGIQDKLRGIAWDSNVKRK